MSEIRVTNVLGENGNSPVNFTKGINMSGIVTATSFVPTVGQLSHRNIIINGACNIAQRGVSATSVSGQYKTVDRFSVNYGGEDEDPTEAQHTLSTSDTPYTLGFRKSFHITNGNQTSGAGAADYVQPQYKIEAQDIANSGWNYTDSNSFITLSFWVKASVAGDYTLNMNTHDGTPYRYLMEYTLTADTWKHVVFKIPGNSNLTVNNDNGLGLQIMWYPFLGSNYIQADQENNWYASSNQKYGTTSTTNWWTTNDATWEITGVQLEVGSVATPFEHRSFGDELSRCQRYFHIIKTGSGEEKYVGQLQVYASGNCHGKYFHFPVTMRAIPTTTLSGTITPTNASGNFSSNFSTATFDRNTTEFVGSNNTSGSSGLTAGNTAAIGLRPNSSISSSAEL